MKVSALAAVLLVACGAPVVERDELAELHAEALGAPPGTGPAVDVADAEPEVLA